MAKNKHKQSEQKQHDSLNVFDEFDGVTSTQIKVDYIKENAIQTKAPEVQSAAMDSCDAQSSQYQANYDNANPHLLAYYVASSSFIGYYACALIAQHWLVSKGCELKARDAVKNGFTINESNGVDLESSKIKLIEKANKKYKLNQNMIEAVKFKNIFGVRHVLFKHKDKNFDYEKPFNPDSFKNGNYAGIAQIDPYWLNPEFDNNDLTDPASIGFYEPTFWTVNGKRYHKSHFVILAGDEVSDYLKPTYRYGGIPLTQKVYERVYASERTANEAPQLAMTKRLNVRKVDLVKAQSNKAQFVKNIQSANEFRDNYGQTIIGKDEDMQNLETSLADLDNVIMTQYQLVCSEFDIPSTKLLGVSPKGFSSGEGEEDNYISSVEELQGNDMNDIIEAHFARLIPSSLSKDLKIQNLEIEVEWNPLKVMSDLELAQMRQANSTADANWYNIDAIDGQDVRDRLVKDKNSGYGGIATPDIEDIE